ncbi:carbonic anhydrase [Candidatus Endowatersipora endosymbiont of Watersipora subatra]|uniref:carbonic anhydrase n=1 Tax=Candidatus Endowatersipora endosymbiont of Watersipora subatra TaxID=3077946 RepID=UPI00312C8D33
MTKILEGTESAVISDGFPQKLLDGYHCFRNHRLIDESERYLELAKTGQKPEIMVIACCDSRSSPEVIFQAAHGEMFVVRNVGNMIPPYMSNGDYGISAALEFAVQGLFVKHIIVMGHRQCGGIQAFQKKIECGIGNPLSPDDFIGKWISFLQPIADCFSLNGPETGEDLQRKLEEQSIRQSISNLKTFPYVSSLLKKNQIHLHGAWFDISSGDLWTLDSRSDLFLKIC